MTIQDDCPLAADSCSYVGASPEDRGRFKREATISSLNHPRNWVLHDIGQEGGTDFLVKEVEGETLALRIARGALPPAGVLFPREVALWQCNTRRPRE
jgi:hypothetical protein